MSADPAATAIRLFISYAWGTPDHEEWVIRLATQLRENGVDVVLDKWDLREGHDANAFMERIVTDEAISKVIIVCDEVYAKKADKRAGGTGTEAQIISATLYNKIDQNKFVAVISERNADGQAYVPTYYGGRIYIDLSDDEIYATNFDQLLRWIYGKPAYVKPSIGGAPAFLTDSRPQLATRQPAQRALAEARRDHSTRNPGALREYLNRLAASIGTLRIVPKSGVELDDQVVESVEAFVPSRNEYVEVLSLHADYGMNSGEVDAIRKFFEQLLQYYYRPRDPASWSEEHADNLVFISHELFLYTIAVLIGKDLFGVVAVLLSSRYYVASEIDSSEAPMRPFQRFRRHLTTLDRRNQRLDLRRLSVHADLLEKRSHASGVDFTALMQADLVLFLRDAAQALRKEHDQKWWPDALVYAERKHAPFECFARAESAGYFERLLPMLEVSSKTELVTVVGELGTKLHPPGLQYRRVDVAGLANISRLATEA